MNRLRMPGPVRLIAAAALLAAAGCSSGSDSSNAAPADAAQVSAAAEVTLDDLMSAPVPGLCDHEPGTLVNGQLPFQDPRRGFVQIHAFGDSGSAGNPLVAFGDLTGDGVGDGAFVTACTAGGVNWPSTIQLYTAGPTRLGGVDLGDVTGGREIATSISIADGAVQARWLTNGENDGACCPSIEVTAQLRWTGSEVVVEHMTRNG